jgi:hypothetical protein
MAVVGKEIQLHAFFGSVLATLAMLQLRAATHLGKHDTMKKHI